MSFFDGLIQYSPASPLEPRPGVGFVWVAGEPSSWTIASALPLTCSISGGDSDEADPAPLTPLGRPEARIKPKSAGALLVEVFGDWRELPCSPFSIAATEVSKLTRFDSFRASTGGCCLSLLGVLNRSVRISRLIVSFFKLLEQPKKQKQKQTKKTHKKRMLSAGAKLRLRLLDDMLLP